MSTTLIDKLYAAFAPVTGKAFRLIAGLHDNGDGNAVPVHVGCTGSMNVTIGDLTGTKDIFARLKVAEPKALFDAKQLFDKQPLHYVEDLTTGGTSTHFPDLAATRMNVTATTGSKVIRQSRIYVPYQPGRAQYIITTGVFGTAVANIRRRQGYFDADNGCFLEQNGTTDLAVVLRTNTSGSPVDGRVVQANWNLDALDGTGPSGLTWDGSEFLVQFIEFGWLGGAGIRIGFFIGGKPIAVHSFSVLGNTTVFMSTPALPLRWEIENLASGSASSMDHVCGVAFSEGGFDTAGTVCSQGRFTGRNVGTTFEPLISVRLKSAYARGTLVPIAANAMVLSTDDMICQVVVRGAPSGGTINWTDSDTGQSEYTLDGNTVSGGIVINTFYVNNNGGQSNTALNNALAVAADFAGTADIIVLKVRCDTGSANVLGSLTWKEII